MSRVRAPSVTPIDQVGARLVPLHCSGPGLSPGRCASSSTAEQRTLNPKVLGSKPRGRTNAGGETRGQSGTRVLDVVVRPERSTFALFGRSFEAVASCG